MKKRGSREPERPSAVGASARRNAKRSAACRWIAVSIGVGWAATAGVATAPPRSRQPSGQAASNQAASNQAAEDNQAVDESTNAALTGEAQTAAEVLELFGIDESQVRFLRDGAPVEGGEWEPVQRLLYLLPRIDVVSQVRWSQPLPPANQMVANPDPYRLKIFRVAGQVTHVSRRTIAPEAARRFGYRQFYVLKFAAAGERAEMTVCTRAIPQAWRRRLEEQGGEVADFDGIPASCNALFLKTGQQSANSATVAAQPSLVFATARVAWHPNQQGGELQVGRGVSELGAFGMDVGLLDDVEHRNALGDADREGFYQILWAVSRTPPRADQAELDIVAALKSPADQVGERFRVRGLARRAIKIRVEDADIRQRYGIDHYFEVELFMPLTKSIRLIDAQDASERTYASFPVTICCRSLPNAFPLGDEIRQRISVQGYFFKLRSYRSNRAGNGGKSFELSPLLVAKTVAVDRSGSRKNPWPAWILAATVIGGAGLALAIQRWYGRTDRKFRQWKERRSAEPNFKLDDADRR